MDFGFGTSPFGEGLFGRADVNREATWERPVPEEVKDQDNGHLQYLLEVSARVLDYFYEKGINLEEQIHPLFAVHPNNGSQTLSVQSSRLIEENPDIFEVTIKNDSNFDHGEFEKVFPKPENEKGGWKAVIGGGRYDIYGVDSYNRTIDIQINTPPSDNSTIDVEPPNILRFIGGNVGLPVDPEDGESSLRRYLWNQSTIKSLKVSRRLFHFLGELFEYHITPERLYCVTEEIYNNIDSSSLADREDVFSKSNKNGDAEYFTVVHPWGHRYDEIPADVMPTDQRTDFEVAVEILSSSHVNPSTNSFQADCEVEVSGDYEQKILSTGYWQIEDSNGDSWWVEGVENGFIYVLGKDVDGDGSDECPSTGNGKLRLNRKLICRKDWKVASAYQITLEHQETPTGMSIKDSLDRMTRKSDYYIPLHLAFTRYVYEYSGTGQALNSDPSVWLDDDNLDFRGIDFESAWITVDNSSTYDLDSLDGVNQGEIHVQSNIQESGTGLDYDLTMVIQG